MCSELASNETNVWFVYTLVRQMHSNLLNLFLEFAFFGSFFSFIQSQDWCRGRILRFKTRHSFTPLLPNVNIGRENMKSISQSYYVFFVSIVNFFAQLSNADRIFYSFASLFFFYFAFDSSDSFHYSSYNAFNSSYIWNICFAGFNSIFDSSILCSNHHLLSDRQKAEYSALFLG